MKLTALVALVAFAGCNHQTEPTAPSEKVDDAEKKKEEEEAAKKKAEEEALKKKEEERAANVAALKALDKTLGSLKGDDKAKAEAEVIKFVASLDLKSEIENQYNANAIVNNVPTLGDLNRDKCLSDRAKVKQHIALVANDETQKRLDTKLKNDSGKTNKDLLLTNLQNAKPSALVSGRAKEDAYNKTLAGLSCEKVTKAERKAVKLELTADETKATSALNDFITKSGAINKFQKAMTSK